MSGPSCGLGQRRGQISAEELDRQRRIAAASPVAAKELVLVGPGEHGHTIVDGLDRTGLRRERPGGRPVAPRLGTAEGSGNRYRAIDLRGEGDGGAPAAVETTRRVDNNFYILTLNRFFFCFSFTFLFLLSRDSV